MKPSPRSATGSLEMRTRIVRAALTIIKSDGFHAVTAPRLAAEIGLRRPIIYYYFQDIEEITIEAVRLSYFEAKDAFLRQTDDRGASLVMADMLGNAAAPMAEFTAMALRNDRFKIVYQDIISDLRSTFAAIFQREGLPKDTSNKLDPDGYALLIQVVAITLATERRLDLSAGHANLKQLMKALRT